MDISSNSTQKSNLIRKVYGLLGKKGIQIIGLASLIGFTFVTLSEWMITNAQGIETVSYWEPNHFIKYFEWLSGSIGVLVGFYQIREVCDE